MINVSFSFDDSLIDTYTLAYPILKKFKLPFTINVISDEVENCSCSFMTTEQLTECYKYGAEIACHGHTHKNTKKDVINNIVSIKNMELFNGEIGFASPNSEITKFNGKDIKELLSDGSISYIRTGVSIRREGILYSILSYIERKTHSKFLFYYLNKKNIIKNVNPQLLMSVAITKYTTNQQIMHLLNKLKNGESVILMFHHIVDDANSGKKGTWTYPKSRFFSLCESIKNNAEIKVMTTMDMVKGK